MQGSGSPTPASVPDLAFTGGCEVSLERAVVPYRSPDDRALPGGRAADLGVGVVLSGPVAGRVEIVDLGSGRVRTTELAPPLVVFGWIFTAPFRELGRRLKGDASDAAPPLAGRVLAQVGYGALTRPLFLRAGFRDLALDLDPHEGTAVRLALPGGAVARAHLDYDRGVLVFRTGRSRPDPALALALPDAFPRRPLFRVSSGAGQGTAELHVHLPELPGLNELRGEMRRLRRGLLHLFARFDETRYRTVMESLSGFGERDLLGGLRTPTPEAPGGLTERIVVPRTNPRLSTGRVH
jgi:hypothetical protein